jgi:hypothetical protein
MAPKAPRSRQLKHVVETALPVAAARHHGTEMQCLQYDMAHAVGNERGALEAGVLCGVVRLFALDADPFVVREPRVAALFAPVAPRLECAHLEPDARMHSDGHKVCKNMQKPEGLDPTSSPGPPCQRQFW